MAPLTQEDSLVFADEAKWHEKAEIPPDPPDTSGLFHSPNLPSESTQIDQSTSPVFRHRSYSLSSDSNQLSPILTTTRLHSRGGSALHPDTPPMLGDNVQPATKMVNTMPVVTPVAECDPEFAQFEDTQVIGGLRSAIADVGETQVIRRKSESGLNESLDRLKFSGPHSFNSRASAMFVPSSGSPFRFHSDTQVIQPVRTKHSESAKSDVQITSSGPHTKVSQILPQDINIPQDTQELPDDTQVILQDTQILPRNSRALPHNTHGLVHETQTLLQNSQTLPLDTQLIPPHAEGMSQSIRVSSEADSLNTTNAIPDGGTTSISKTERNTLNISNINEFSSAKLSKKLLLPKNISQDTLDGSKMNEDLQNSSRPDNDYVQSNTNETLRSIEWGDTQPMTQVVNFHPAQVNHMNMESSPTKNFDFEVDTTTLVLSPADQNRICEEPTTQVVNTQEELIDHNGLSGVAIGCKSVFSSSQNERISNPNMSIISNDDYNKDDIENSVLYEDSVITHRRKRQKLLADQNVFGPNEIEEIKPDNSITEESQVTKENDDFTSGVSSIPTFTNLPHKNSWSQSSSELEDFSHDVGFDVDMIGADNDVTQAEESHVEITVPRLRRSNQIPETQSQPEELREESLMRLTIDNIHNQQAVWALSQFKHHPGRVLRLGESVSLVEFSDLILEEIKNEDLYILDLRIGDVVLLKLRLGEFIVTGLVCLYEESCFKCMRGFDTAMVTKKGRHGYSQGKEFQVAISQIYMEMGMWTEHQLRYQLFFGDIDFSHESYGTVRNKLESTEIEGAPATTKGNGISLKLLQPIPNDSESRDVLKKSDLFSDMVFFVTSVNDDRKSQLSQLIISNGGIFIDDEIKLFVLSGTSAGNELCLKLNRFEGLRFGALLSDGCSRSAKYLQALALGWPILADSFVDQAIANPNILDNWPVYLLPAGHSLYIKGLKSHDIFRFRENYGRGLDLNNQLSNNSKLLASEVIIILDKKQDPKTLDMCEFIFHAFGAKAIKFCKTINGIDRLLKELKGKHVMVYDNGSNEYVKSAPKKTLKRATAKHNVGVIGWEWLVQCVISCYIWQPDHRVNV